MEHKSLRHRIKHTPLGKYLALIVDESPNIIQIISLPAIFGLLLLENVIISSIIACIGCILIPFYLLQRSEKLELPHHLWLAYNAVSGVIAAIILFGILNLNRPS
jgi:hypothetical protein